ncbi:hypothetical protein [Erythrobacter sp. F6033]|uniref:hypothetical protein n=1 Tax=Erythrobacter sp. F6033 TaxID=2926401 RepID=UPI001FF421AF|nr:hypothetical protein [Erythrobacter sp. F6033]MCK0128061.1 hypothetical protein [Erythrobacter sp. F6033]
MNDFASQIPVGQEAKSVQEGGDVAIEPWSSDFATCEHPETARLRIERDFIESIIGIKRYPTDQVYDYLNALIEKAKAELGHARSASNDLRRATLQQHLDELVAYCTGHGINVRLPNRNGDALEEALASFYVLEEIPAFLGEIKFLIDLWYTDALAKVHEEMLALTNLSGHLR